MNGIENLHEWSLKMQGAREMLEAIIASVKESGGKFCLDNAGRDSKVYHEAIVRLILSNLDNIGKFMQGRMIGYCNHQKDKKGKLISCDAYFL